MNGFLHRFALAGACSAAVGCSAFKVNVGTPDPIKMDAIDIKVRMDIYQHRDDKPSDPTKAAEDQKQARVRIYNRQEKIQQLKNQRMLVETHKGILRVREMPADPNWKEDIIKTVEDENKDRVIIMRHDAEQRSVDVYEIEKERWKENVAKSFKDEWIEEEDAAKPGKFIDKQKP